MGSSQRNIFNFSLTTLDFYAKPCRITKSQHKQQKRRNTKMDEFPWKYVIFYAFYYNGREYIGNTTISRRIPLNSADEFREMEVFVRRDLQKKDYFYGIGFVVTGFALLAKPSVWERIKLYFHN